MPLTVHGRTLPTVLVQPDPPTPPGARERHDSARRGFGSRLPGAAPRSRQGRKRSSVLSRQDWGPLGKHPDREAIVARQRLHLPLSGRISPGEVSKAWKRAAAEHHPDRGGAHDTMQRINAARNLLLNPSN